MTEMNLVQAINAALKQEMQRDPKILVYGEDVGVNGGVFRVTDGLIKQFPNQVFDTPLAEGAIVGTGVGLAVYGFRPVCEIQFDGFLPGAFDQIISHVGRIRNRSRGRYTCPIVIRAPFTGGIHAPEHHSESTEACYIHVPGIKVVMPSTPRDAKGIMASALRSEDPVIFMEPKRLYRAIKEDVPEEAYTIPIGEAKILHPGTELTVVTWGAMTVPVQQAVVASGVDCEIIDLRTLSPLDIKTIQASVEKTGRCLIVHEAPRTLGLGAEIAAQLQERCLYSLKAPVERVTGWDTPMPLYRLEQAYLPSPERILSGIKKVMAT